MDEIRARPWQPLGSDVPLLIAHTTSTYPCPPTSSTSG